MNTRIPPPIPTLERARAYTELIRARNELVALERQRSAWLDCYFGAEREGYAAEAKMAAENLQALRPQVESIQRTIATYTRQAGVEKSHIRLRNGEPVE